ncbi:hypothetical protein [Brevundimonas sp.]|uniref:hypothetical protein n=1 Tax=Brevundimonas sp. TaxID=1871086 RepID=UPI0035B228C6
MTHTNAQLFADAGRALFGERWQQPTAELLGWPVDDKGQNRTVQRIKAAAEKGEEYRIAPGAMLELAQHLENRAGQCSTLARAIKGG